ncbi:hypothetical protein QL285_059021 [Trifolium repens]|nr:hypothetical protein QL285_059021 [Trifolium repens]
MAYFKLSNSISFRFLILLIITFTLFMQLAPVTADIKMRKLGNTASPPPSPIRNHPPGTISNPIILRLKSGVDGSENFLVIYEDEETNQVHVLQGQLVAIVLHQVIIHRNDRGHSPKNFI